MDDPSSRASPVEVRGVLEDLRVVVQTTREPISRASDPACRLDNRSRTAAFAAGLFGGAVGSPPELVLLRWLPRAIRR
jgi:hypothetical protein